MRLVPLVLCSLIVAVLVLPGASRAAIPCELVVGDPCLCLFKDADGSTAIVDISSYFDYP